MIVQLVDAAAPTCGGKAGALGAMLRACLPVPDGVVVPLAAYREATGHLGLPRLARGSGDGDAARRAIAAGPLPDGLRTELARELDRLGDPPVAVRSSASDEDLTHASAAGQHETVLGVQGVDAVADAVRACWASLYSSGAIAYRGGRGGSVRAGRLSPARRGTSEEPAMAVIVQRLVDADVSGVMFTGPGGATRVEASWGLGTSVVGGTVSPDAYEVLADGTVRRAPGDKRTRVDRVGSRVVETDVPAGQRLRLTLDDTTVGRLAALGQQVATLIGGHVDVEWAVAAGRVSLLQARPVTAAPPQVRPSGTARVPASSSMLIGSAGSRGTVTGVVRVVRGPDDFARASAGDILVCLWTDPSWTPLLGVVGGVVTQTGGALSHAAIVAREHGIPAVLGVPDALTRLRDGDRVTVDGTAGTVTIDRA
ncbi:PEP/pyruvate-binding domain-containing protein [Actinotalea subterranea]|uniref:PEP/pyruvate-binding domain-containing protein n=1 Tax=Actinotalea subterranea TaxID=2607497 RepID=UPI0011ECCEAE|nr:PEP/pyruvate-binding domain-containing protein [Actinotalea subterranea]